MAGTTLVAAQANPLASLFGLAWLCGLVLAIVVWVDALATRPAVWTAAGYDKTKFFVAWYVGGLLTVGVVPMVMSVWYVKSLWAEFGAGRRTRFSKTFSPTSTAPTGQLIPHQGTGIAASDAPPSANTPLHPPAWLTDPLAMKRLRYWDGASWTDHVSD